ncbi:MAG: hypothetical protein MJ229_03610 [bacterium]|nr:hypothetical protein [bacterium]
MKNNVINIFIFVVLVIAFLITGYIVFQKPVMHKPFNVNVINYFIKFKDDGSLETTKQVTTTKYVEAGK